MKKFYFSYGDAPAYPFRGGWTEVTARDAETAVAAFKLVHPCPRGKEYINCAFVYDAETFEKLEIFKEGNAGAKRHEVIKVEITIKKIKQGGTTR